MIKTAVMHKLPANRIRLPAVLLLALLCLGGCGLFTPHKVSVQQGNIVAQHKVDQLKPGMSKRQVRFVLGSPLVVDALNPDQWHYIYTLDLGNGQLLRRELSLRFEEGKLTELSGDYLPAAATGEESPTQESAQGEER